MLTLYEIICEFHIVVLSMTWVLLSCTIWHGFPLNKTCLVVYPCSASNPWLHSGLVSVLTYQNVFLIPWNTNYLVTLCTLFSNITHNPQQTPTSSCRSVMAAILACVHWVCEPHLSSSGFKMSWSHPWSVHLSSSHSFGSMIKIMIE